MDIKEIIIGDLITYLQEESFSNKCKQLRAYTQVAKPHQDYCFQYGFLKWSDVIWLLRYSCRIIYKLREVFCDGVQVLHGELFKRII